MAHHHTHTHARTHACMHTCMHTHLLTYSLTHAHMHAHTLTLTHSHSLSHTQTHALRDMFKEAWICLAEQFLELYGKVEVVVRNCLLRWSGHLFEVTGTHLFDQSFCFKLINLFCAPTGAFFRWYPSFLFYTKDFTCRSELSLNPCISAMNQDYEK